MKRLSLSTAEEIADGVGRYSLDHGLKPLTIMILDEAGVPLLFKRADGSPWIRYDIALAKAWGCMAMGLGGRAIEQRADSAPSLLNLVNMITGGKVAAVAGGILIKNTDRDVIGAIGVSGDHPDNDEKAAVAGCEGAGLFADTGA